MRKCALIECWAGSAPSFTYKFNACLYALHYVTFLATNYQAPALGCLWRLDFFDVLIPFIQMTQVCISYEYNY